MTNKPKAITLIGMSGVGKTYLSSRLAEWGWVHFSCDVDIARTIFPDKTDILADDISELSMFLGQLGDPEQDGMPYDQFKERQSMYYEAEIAALRKVPGLVQRAGDQNFIHDSTGSFCEILDQDVIEKIAESTLIVYIKASEQEEQALIQRAQEYPKPLFFPPENFDVWLEEYLKERGHKSWNGMDPNDFSRWVFPKLLASRKPKYQSIADQYGVSVPSAAFQDVANEDAFLSLLEDAGVEAA